MNDDEENDDDPTMENFYLLIFFFSVFVRNGIVLRSTALRCAALCFV